MTKSDGIAMTIAFIGGALAGAAAGILFAPEKGEVQRKKIQDVLEKYGVKLKKKDLEDLVEDLKDSEIIDALDA